MEEFEKAYLDHLRANHASVLATIRDDKKWTKELAAELDGIAAAYVKEFTA